MGAVEDASPLLFVVVTACEAVDDVSTAATLDVVDDVTFGVGEGVVGVGDAVFGVGEGVFGVGEGVGRGVGDGVGEGVGDGVGAGVGLGVGGNGALNDDVRQSASTLLDVRRMRASGGGVHVDTSSDT